MQHIFIKGSSETTLILLHGTGGDEHSLVDIGRFLLPNANLLSIKGNIDENGLTRFFKRKSFGIFDEEDLIFRTKELYDFLQSAAKQYRFDLTKAVGYGYSNGANILGNMLIQIPRSITQAVLAHPMVPRRGIDLPDLSHTHVLITAGDNDPIAPMSESRELERMLKSASADVSMYIGHKEHAISKEELEAVKTWLKKKELIQ